MPTDDLLERSVRLANDDRKQKNDQGPGTAVITKTRPQTKRPHLYRVLLLNDDYTPMEFVVHVLERFFNTRTTTPAAQRIMMHVHQQGIGECGVFTYEVAGNQSDAGYGLCPKTSASFTVHHGKEVTRGNGHYKWKMKRA